MNNRYKHSIIIFVIFGLGTTSIHAGWTSFTNFSISNVFNSIKKELQFSYYTIATGLVLTATALIGLRVYNNNKMKIAKLKKEQEKKEEQEQKRQEEEEKKQQEELEQQKDEGQAKEAERLVYEQEMQLRQLQERDREEKTRLLQEQEEHKRKEEERRRQELEETQEQQEQQQKEEAEQRQQEEHERLAQLEREKEEQQRQQHKLDERKQQEQQRRQEKEQRQSEQLKLEQQRKEQKRLEQEKRARLEEQRMEQDRKHREKLAQLEQELERRNTELRRQQEQEIAQERQKQAQLTEQQKQARLEYENNPIHQTTLFLDGIVNNLPRSIDPTNNAYNPDVLFYHMAHQKTSSATVRQLFELNPHLNPTMTTRYFGPLFFICAYKDSEQEALKLFNVFKDQLKKNDILNQTDDKGLTIRVLAHSKGYTKLYNYLTLTYYPAERQRIITSTPTIEILNP